MLSFPRKESLVLSSSSVGVDAEGGGEGREPADPGVSRNSRTSGLGVADAIEGFVQHHPLTFPQATCGPGPQPQHPGSLMENTEFWVHNTGDLESAF